MLTDLRGTDTVAPGLLLDCLGVVESIESISQPF